MSINVNRSLVITDSNQNSFICHYTFDKNEIIRVSRVRDLGLILYSNLSFNTHISEMISKSLKSLGLQ